MFAIDIETKEKLRAQVGIGTLIVFIAMVLVAAIAAGVLINTAGFLQSKSEQTGQQSGDQVTNRLQVLQATGLKKDQGTGDPTSIGVVQLHVTKAPGANDIDLTGLTMQWVDNTGTYDIVHERVFDYNVDGEFAHKAIKDEDGSLDSGDSATPVINSADDRALIVIAISAPEYPISGYNSTDPNAQLDNNRVGGTADGLIRSTFATNDGNRLIDSYEGGLEEGSSASLRITTASGTATTVQIVVPESLSGKTAVRL